MIPHVEGPGLAAGVTAIAGTTCDTGTAGAGDSIAGIADADPPVPAGGGTSADRCGLAALERAPPPAGNKGVPPRGATGIRGWLEPGSGPPGGAFAGPPEPTRAPFTAFARAFQPGSAAANFRIGFGFGFGGAGLYCGNGLPPRLVAISHAWVNGIPGIGHLQVMPPSPLDTGRACSPVASPGKTTIPTSAGGGGEPAGHVGSAADRSTLA